MSTGSLVVSLKVKLATSEYEWEDELVISKVANGELAWCKLNGYSPLTSPRGVGLLLVRSYGWSLLLVSSHGCELTTVVPNGCGILARW